MINISKLIYKTTGIMSKKQIIRTCENVGNRLSDELLTGGGGADKASRVKELLTDAIGAKKASKVIITDDLATFKEFTAKELNFTDDLAEKFFQQSKSAVIPGPKSNKSLLSLRIKNMRPEEAVNSSSHELEHVLYQRLGFRPFRERIYLKIRGKKYLENYLQKYASLMNEKNMVLQGNLLLKSKLGSSATYGFTSYEAGIEGLLKQTGMKSKEELHKMLENLIRERIILPDCDKRNLKVLKALKALLKDESRAYKVGGKVERRHTDALNLKSLTENGSASEFKPATNLTKSEMLAQLYNEAIVILKKEVRHQRMNKFKSFFGLKPKDYNIKPEPPATTRRVVPEEEILEMDLPKEILDELNI